LSLVVTRFLLALAAALIGGVLGWWVESLTGLSWVAVLMAAAAASGSIIAIDGWRGHRLLAWLRGSQQGTAPRDAGLWGELAYRVERSIRDREREIAREQSQLAQFLSAIEASPNGVLMLDSHDQIVWCNRVAADHFSLDPVRDLRQRITNLVRSPSFVALMQAGETKEALTLTGLRSRGSVSVLLRDYGEGMKLVLSQDVTERERADAMRRDFVANVSHEIRTPLTVLAGFIETLQSLPLTEVERARVLLLMGQQTARMQTLVADLLTLATLEGSPRPAPDRWVSLDALVARVAADAQALSQGKHRIRFDAATGVELAGVESELASALGNLMTNAVRYTPEGGDVELRWRLHEGGTGEVVVADTGLGIAREHIPRLTERFYRVDGSRSRETGGTGLGLSIVKHVMQRHGGELLIESEVDKGSRFRLIFPAARVRETSDTPLGAEAAFLGGRGSAPA
jgi:two-component system phosphate regulon sensor histidine kinase PhoR